MVIISAASGDKDKEMAFVASGFNLTIGMQDNGGNLTNVQYQLTSADYATAVTDATTIRDALVLVSDGVITSYYLTERYDNDIVGFPGAGIQAEVSASLTTLIAEAGAKKANIRIPMPKQTIFVALSGDGANNVDMTNLQVIAYHALFADGQQAFISDGETAGTLLSGVRVTRAARRG